MGTNRSLTRCGPPCRVPAGRAPRARACLACGLAALVLASVAARPVAAADASAQALHKLLDEEWRWQLGQYPEAATTYGESGYDDRLTDLSAPAVAARRAHHRELLAAVHAIDRAQLAGEDRLSWGVLDFTADNDVRIDDILASRPAQGATPWSAQDSPFAVTPMGGPQFDWPQLVRATRFAAQPDYEHYLARLQAMPEYLRQLRAQLDAGRIAGWMPPRSALQRVPGQFDALLDAHLESNPLYAPFKDMPPDMPVPVQDALRAAGRHELDDGVIPAVRRFRDFLAQTWVPAGAAALGASALPRGAELYALWLQHHNSTRKSAREIHELGLEEGARLDGEMRAAMRETGFQGGLADFRAYLRTDPRFQFTRGEDELIAFRDIAKRVDPLLPTLFAELPRLPYGVRAMSPEEGDNAPHYVGGAIDGSRAGYFEANVHNLATWPRWTMEDLFLHEAVPGHHLQSARAREMTTLPKLRRVYDNAGYVEGWGLYAEGLGGALGLYTDPYSRFGHLSLDAQRAARLVVDTGLHTMGWTREQATAYLIEHAQLERAFAEAEVDRYLVLPGQATAYKIGQLTILALRERAKAALGPRFDIRRFHNAVLDHGALPLAVLEHAIDDWIEAERARHD